jgi:hypothetical protein
MKEVEIDRARSTHREEVPAVFVIKSESKKPFWGPRNRWYDDIKKVVKSL